MRLSIYLFVAVLMTASAGCAGASRESMWMNQHGGLLHDHRLERLARVAAPVADRVAPECRFRVLNTSELSAYAWPDQAIYVSRGLIDRLDDVELVAVVAHELGHLLDDGHITPPAGLWGDSVNGDDPEARADAMAIALLDQIGAPRGALGDMLEKVAVSDGMQSDTRKKMMVRAARARGR